MPYCNLAMKTIVNKIVLVVKMLFNNFEQLCERDVIIWLVKYEYMILFPDLARMYFFGWDAMVTLLGLAGVGMAEQHKRNLILIFIRIIMKVILVLVLFILLLIYEYYTILLLLIISIIIILTIVLNTLLTEIQ